MATWCSSRALFLVTFLSFGSAYPHGQSRLLQHRHLNFASELGRTRIYLQRRRSISESGRRSILKAPKIILRQNAEEVAVTNRMEVASVASTTEGRVQQLVELIQRGRERTEILPRAPLTNLTLLENGGNILDGQIRSAVRLLESFRCYQPPVLKNKSALFDINGPWRLIYSDASEITRLYKLPGRFRPEAVFQRINITRKTFENQAFLNGPAGTRASIRVVSEFEVASKDSINYIGKLNTDEDRIEVRFLAVVLSLRKLLGLPVPFIRRVVKPNRASKDEDENGIGPSLDTTFVDGNLRIGRGGDGSLFVLVKDLDDPSVPLTEAAVKNLRPANKIFDASEGRVKNIQKQ